MVTPIFALNLVTPLLARTTPLRPWGWLRVWGVRFVLCSACALAAQTPAPLVLGTPSSGGTYDGTLLRRIYKELFGRIGVPIDIQSYPVARLNVEMDNGKIDGDTARALAFGESHPKFLRITEPVMEVGFALWASNPKVQLSRLEDLAASGMTVGYARGVVVCEQALRAQLPPDRVVDITGNVNGLEMMHLGRLQLYCGLDLSVISESQEFLPKRALPFKVLDVGKPAPLYLYLQPKHAQLVAPITAMLKKMHADGTVERIRKDTLRDFKYPVN